MKKTEAKKEDEFLYPGDVWSGILGDNYKEKIEEFLRKSIANAKYKDMKIINNNLYTFLEWKPEKSPMAYELILEDEGEGKDRHLAFVTGCPFMEGKKNKFNVVRIHDSADNGRLEGYVGLSFGDAADMMAYNPLYALQRSVFCHLKPNKKSEYHANLCVAGLALSIKKSPRKIIKVDKGGFYEVMLKEFLEKNPSKTEADFSCPEIDASHMSALFPKEIKDECEYVSDIYSVKKFRFNDTDFYRLEIEVIRDIETDKGMKVYLYVNKELLGKYEPKVKDNIQGMMQLTAYLDDKECSKILETSKEDVGIITANGKIPYKVEIPITEDEFYNGLAFRDSLPAQTGMLYKYHSENVCMHTAQTKVPVDYIFTDLCGNIMKIDRDVKPLSHDLHRCCNTTGVLEINKGEADKLGIKEGDILIHRFLTPCKDYGKLTIKEADHYYRYDKDLYAEKNGNLYFYSFKSHAWYDAKSTHYEDKLLKRMANCRDMGLEKKMLSEPEIEFFMNEFENELRSDYAKKLKRYYRLHEKLLYSHDEINDKYELYSFEKGWINMWWIRNEHRTLILNRDMALKLTSDDVEELIKKYQKEEKKNGYPADLDNLIRLHFFGDGSPSSKYYLTKDNTLWWINEPHKVHKILNIKSRKWEDAEFSEDTLKAEIENAVKNGKRYLWPELPEVIIKLLRK